MYHYIQDKDFLNRMKRHCAGMIDQLVQSINNDSVMKVKADLVGSGAQNLITQNEKEAIDLDYNLCMIDTGEFHFPDGRRSKEYIRKKFNEILQKNGWDDCQDSRSVLTTGKVKFKQTDKTEFGIDLAIIYKDKNGSHRLIHEKTGVTYLDRYYWNTVPRSEGLEKKVAALKSKGLWTELRNVYLDKKNFYLCRNDHDHPSFIVYIETVNQIYDKYFR